MADTPRQATPVAPTADAIVGELKARAARLAAYQLLRAARLLLYRESLEAPLARPQADWYAAWRAVRAASAAGDLGAGVDGLVRAAAAWREVGRVCGRWRAEGEAWSARVTAAGDAPVNYYPEGVPDGPVARWAALIFTRPGLPTLAAPLARPECEFGLAVLRIVADAGVTAGHFRDFFAHEPFDAVQGQALGMAVAMVPPPAGLALDPGECPRPPAAVARALVCLVTGCHDGAREYLAAAMEFLEAPAAGLVPQQTQNAFAPLLEPDDLGARVEELQRMVAEAGGRPDPASAPTPLTPASPAGVTIAELERRLSDCERAEGAVPAVGVATVSIREYASRAREAALRSGHLAELRDAVTSVPGYAELQTLCLKLMRCELTAAVCVRIRCMLVDTDLSGTEAGAKTVPEVVVLLNSFVRSRNTGPQDHSAHRDRRGGGDYARGDLEVAPAIFLRATGGRGSGAAVESEPELTGSAPNPVVPADPLGKRRGPPLLSERDADKWKLYLLIHKDYASHPRERTASKLLERLKSQPSVLALCDGKLTRDVVLAWEKHFKESPNQYPTEMPRGNPPKD